MFIPFGYHFVLVKCGIGIFVVAIAVEFYFACVVFLYAYTLFVAQKGGERCFACVKTMALTWRWGRKRKHRGINRQISGFDDDNRCCSCLCAGEGEELSEQKRVYELVVAEYRKDLKQTLTEENHPKF